MKHTRLLTLSIMFKSQPIVLCLSFSFSPTSKHVQILIFDIGSYNRSLIISILLIPFLDRISSSNVYGAVPPPQQLLAGTDTSGARSDVHYTLGPNVLSGAPHSFASTAVIAPVVAPAVAVQSGAPTYSGVPSPSNMAYPIPPVNGGAFYNGYGDIYPQATPLQQVAFTLKHASSSAAQAVPVTSTPTSMATKENSTLDVETDKRSRRKFQELPVSKGPTESQVQSVLFFFLIQPRLNS